MVLSVVEVPAGIVVARHAGRHVGSRSVAHVVELRHLRRLV